MELDDDGQFPPCLDCDEPVAIDPDGHPYDRCPAHLLERSEPFERHAPDPDDQLQALRDRRAPATHTH